jgi:hypothetical protein
MSDISNQAVQWAILRQVENVLGNVTIKDAVISVERVDNTLVFTNQAKETYSFDLQNLDIDTITSDVIKECKDYSTEQIKQLGELLTESLQTLSKDLLTNMSSIEQSLLKRLRSLDISKDSLDKDIASIKKSFNEYYSKLQVNSLVATTKESLAKVDSSLKQEIEDLKKADAEILQSVKDITSLFNSDELSFVQDSYIKNNTLFVKKHGKTKQSGAFTGGGGGGGSELYTNPNPTPNDFGGIPAGTTFLNVPQNMMWSMSLYGSKLPVFNSFVITGLKSVYEVGEKIVAGNYNAIWTMSDPEMLQEKSIEIDYTNDSLVLASGLDNTGSQVISLPEITFSYIESAIFKIKAISTSLQNVNKLLIINYMYKIYYGESPLDVLTTQALKTLRASKLDENVDGMYLTEPGNYKYICYPKILGLRDDFIDESTDLEIVMAEPQLLKITNDFGLEIDYYCYRTFNKLGSSLNIIVR